jgi:hypothetical protein
MTNDKISACISLVVAIAILAASFRQWWDISYNGQMITRPWVKILFVVAIATLILALALILI